MINTQQQVKHTPGPWTHNQGSPVVHADGVFIAQVEQYNNLHLPKEYQERVLYYGDRIGQAIAKAKGNA